MRQTDAWICVGVCQANDDFLSESRNSSKGLRGSDRTLSGIGRIKLVLVQLGPTLRTGSASSSSHAGGQVSAETRAC